MPQERNEHIEFQRLKLNRFTAFHDRVRFDVDNDILDAIAAFHFPIRFSTFSMRTINVRGSKGFTI